MNLRDWIKECEGFNAHPYLDTVQRVTIGWGRNLDDTGISQDEAELMLTNDINTAIKELEKFEWYTMQPEGVKNALINMCFNMGITRLLTFKKMISALESKNYAEASQQALDSKWAKQVGKRANSVSDKLKLGI